MIKTLNFPKNIISVCLTGVCLLLFPLFISGAQEAEYRIGAGDELNLTIYAGGEKQREIQPLVSGKGMISVPFIGSFRTGGLTLPEAEAGIKEMLVNRGYFIEPEVNIHIKEYHSLRYHIAGAVKEPGLYELRSQISLIELIARAGGVLPDRGNVAYILHNASGLPEKDMEKLVSGEKTEKADLSALLDAGDMSRNMQLESGSLVWIPLEKSLDTDQSRIFVGGYVKNPGSYPFQPGLTALNACLIAGGFDKFAAPNRTRIIRRENGKQVVIEKNLEDVKNGEVPDIELKAGDRIQVPKTWI